MQAMHASQTCQHCQRPLVTIQPFTASFPPQRSPSQRWPRAKHRLVRADAQAAVEDPASSSFASIPSHLNGTPMPREVRRFFYNEAAHAMLKALELGQRRMQIRCRIPELDVETDVYRIGTLLEMVRTMAVSLAQDGKSVKVCVQEAMGAGVFQGLPLSLSGVKRIMTQMDWGDAEDFVRFGAVGGQHIDDCDFYILLCPQNVVGNTIMTGLLDMMEKAEEAGKAMVLVNPALKDIPSHSGIMGVRGRAERMAFAKTFEPAYHFRLLYLPGQLYPIMGALRYCAGESWQVYKRTDIGKRQEIYQPVGVFDREPNGAEITACFRPKPEKPAGFWWS